MTRHPPPLAPDFGDTQQNSGPPQADKYTCSDAAVTGRGRVAARPAAQRRLEAPARPRIHLLAAAAARAHAQPPTHKSINNHPAGGDRRRRAKISRAALGEGSPVRLGDGAHVAALTQRSSERPIIHEATPSAGAGRRRSCRGPARAGHRDHRPGPRWGQKVSEYMSQSAFLKDKDTGSVKVAASNRKRKRQLLANRFVATICESKKKKKKKKTGLECLDDKVSLCTRPVECDAAALRWLAPQRGGVANAPPPIFKAVLWASLPSGCIRQSGVRGSRYLASTSG